MMRVTVGFALATGIALFALPASAEPSTTSIEQGYDLGEIQHPRTVALAGAQQVFGGSTSAVFANPANLPLYRVYHLEGIAAIAPEARRQSYGAAIADSSTSRLSGGAGGTYNVLDPDGIKRSWADIRVALAYPLGDRLSLGVSGRYLRVTQRTAAGPFGGSLVSDGTKDDPLFNGFTFDAGAALSITENLRAAVSGRNLTAPNTALAPTALAGGIGWSNQTITVEVDSLVDFTTYGTARARYMGGVEALLADRFPVRLGYRFDDGMKTHAVGLGLGYVDKRFSLELAGRRDVSADNPSTIVSLGLRLFIDQNTGGQLDQPDSF